ncbi:hypothetical protein D3C84_547670 [compost metagenome]
MGIVLLVGRVEAPTLTIELLIPQVALRTGQASRAFTAATAAGQSASFVADPGDCRPLKRIMAATAYRAVILAKEGL